MMNRRKFLGYSLSAGGSLMIMGTIPGYATSSSSGSSLDSDTYSSLYLEVKADNTFYLTFDKCEMGQGIITGQATMFGEEADISPASFVMRSAPADERFGTILGHMVTGGSTSITTGFDSFRKIGAAYRHGVLTAAAGRWQVDMKELETDNGFVLHPKSQRKAPYASFNQDLAGIEVPEDIPLKEKSQWKYIGKFNDSIDAKDKVTGTPEYGVDFSLEGMKTAIVVRSPAFKGKLKSFDRERISKLGDVVDMIEISSGLAIVCDSYWRCLKIKNALQADMFTWDNSNASLHNTPELRKQYQTASKLDKEDVAEGQKLVQGEYILPYLNHAPMEPQNAVGWKQKDRLEFWLPTQAPTFIKAYSEKVSDFDEEQIFVHNSKYLGGGFGRRAHMDYGIEIIELTLAVDYPVKLMWSREDDVQHSPLRPMSVHNLQAVVDPEKKDAPVLKWQHRVAAESIMQELSEEVMPLMMPKWISSSIGGILSLTGVNPFAVEGAKQPYDLPYDVDSVEQESSAPVTFWRSVGNSHNGFVVESFVDEVAHSLGADPYQFRLQHLKNDPRAAAVVEKAAELSSWKSYPKSGKKALGFAYHFSFNTHCAEIAEVEVVNGAIRIHKVYAVVDCGVVINPDIVKKQVESGIIYGLSAALHGKIEFKDGAITQSNFHDYPMLRLQETPEIVVHLMESGEHPTGIGEPGFPPIAAAVGNGLFKLTGKRLRDLPFNLS